MHSQIPGPQNETFWNFIICFHIVSTGQVSS